MIDSKTSWINPLSISKNNYIVSTKHYGGYSLGLNITRGGKCPNAVLARCMVTGKYHNICSQTKLETNNWYHIALAYDGNYFRLYVNGTEDASKKVTGKLSPSKRKSFFYWRRIRWERS